MTGTIANVVGLLAASGTARRRARNLRAGARGGKAQRTGAHAASWPRWRNPGAVFWIGLAGVLFALAGAWVIAAHALNLAETARQVAPQAASVQLAALQRALPGAAFTVPSAGGVSVQRAPGGAVLVLGRMDAAPPLHIDLCAQILDLARPRLLPLRIGYRFDDVAKWVAAGAPAPLRNVVLAAPGAPMPALDIDGVAAPDFARAGSQPLRVRWSGDARWVAGSAVTQPGQGALWREGWLVWHGDSALRVIRRASAACPQAGELVLQLYRPGAAAGTRSLVVGLPAQGETVSAWLEPGDYRVPATGIAPLEDEALFDQLQARGLVRLGASGLVELAPPDLAAFLAAPAAARAAPLDGWEQVRLDAAGRKLVERLYHKADGDYVREQVRIFNSERRLLAWRQRAGTSAAWQVGVAGAAQATSTVLPAAAARLFAQLPQGWGPWTRVADWPPASQQAQLTLALPQAGDAGQAVTLMLAGRVTQVRGARLRSAVDACTGRGCPGPDAVREIVLEPLPGARSIALTVAPLDMATVALAADQQYRHLRVEHGRLSWQPLPGRPAVPAATAAQVRLVDRNGSSIFSDGAASSAAAAAGLAPLLGIHPRHDNSVAGMLARLPSATGTHAARLSLDPGLQAASQAALECIGMRHGRLAGATCANAGPAPAGRQAGLVIIDTETGDVLAAAGAGGGQVTPANWAEVRDFDRADPARSPLRLPAFQHDGGANRSPGSTFKVISALGLELAARHDRQLDALLGGLPLARINSIAQDKGFAFRTDAAAYPTSGRLAHITNFREQQLDRRAQGGRLGLEQALAYSLNTWFAWTGELSDKSLFARADGGAPDLQPLAPGALDGARPIVAMARKLGFDQPLRLDGGLLPADYPWSSWDALQGTPAHMDPIHTRHELRQMAIGLRMQVTPLQMALAAGAVGQGRVIVPRLLLELDGRRAASAQGAPLGVRLDRIRAGMKGVVDMGTAAGAFRAHEFDVLRPGLFGKTGTAPTGQRDGAGRELATVWFTGWLEPGSIPGQSHRLALAAFVSQSEATGGEHAAPIVAAVLRSLLHQNGEEGQSRHSSATVKRVCMALFC
jgi:cell division protein FtsI/penicillin-binding protein 2